MPSGEGGNHPVYLGRFGQDWFEMISALFVDGGIWQFGMWNFGILQLYLVKLGQKKRRQMCPVYVRRDRSRWTARTSSQQLSRFLQTSTTAFAIPFPMAFGIQCPLRLNWREGGPDRLRLAISFDGGQEVNRETRSRLTCGSYRIAESVNRSAWRRLGLHDMRVSRLVKLRL